MVPEWIQLRVTNSSAGLFGVLLDAHTRTHTHTHYTGQFYIDRQNNLL